MENESASAGAFQRVLTGGADRALQMEIQLPERKTTKQKNVLWFFYALLKDRIPDGNLT